MSEPELPERAGDLPRGRFGNASFLHRQLPYIIVLALAVAGVAYTNISRQPLIGYWEFLTLAMAVLCVVTEWPKVADRSSRWRLILKHALHWGAILVAMNIMLLYGVQQLLPSPATSLVLLMLLALGTFLAGLNIRSLQICFLGLAMAFAVPAIAWFKQFALFFVLAAVVLIGLGLAFWPRRQAQQPPPNPGENPTP
ncbi:MAG TPA: hypothetical protein VGF60_17430 [Xanthobacteraceae bacterium]|jgi:hypothetical protein